MRLPFKRSEPGVVVSGLAHVAILGAALAAFTTQTLPEAQEGIPVEVMTDQQFSEITKGQRDGQKPQPNARPRADRVAEKTEERDPGEAKQNVPSPPTRPPEMKTAEAEETPAPMPPLRPALEQPAPPQRPPEKTAQDKAEAQKAEAAQKAAAAAKAEAEAERREELAKLVERQEAEAELKAAQEAKRQADARAKARADAKAKAEADAAAAEAKAAALAEAKAEAERLKKVAEAKEAKVKAAEVKAAEAKAADAKARADAEAKARAKAELAAKFNAGAIQSLLASKEPAQSTGATGREVQRVASLGTETGISQRLSPSQRDALVGLLQQQIERCYSAPPGAGAGVVLPTLDIRLNPDGSFASEPRIMRGGASSVDASVAQAALRAVRRCAPYRIPAQFAPYYNDWKTINATFDLPKA